MVFVAAEVSFRVFSPLFYCCLVRDRNLTKLADKEEVKYLYFFNKRSRTKT